MTTCSTHVLDAARGLPAVGLAVTLTRLEAGPGETSVLAAAVTDDEGRIRWDSALAADGHDAELAPGAYRVGFATGDWFANAERDTFFPTVDLTVNIAGPHVHVALLLSPFAYTTYRGS